LGSIEDEMTTHFIWTFSDALLAALLLVVGVVFLGERIARKWRKK
jgi:membrane-bound ClpP family serine protease